jgi:hypothetical protein
MKTVLNMFYELRRTMAVHVLNSACTSGIGLGLRQRPW